MGQKETDKKDQGKKDGAGSSGAGDGGVVTVVLKADLHCEGCAQKVKRTVKRLNGVESVNTDFATKKITVVGKVDPAKVKERVEEKTKKKVDLVAPQPPSKKDKDAGGGGGGGGNGGGKSSDAPPPADNNKKAEQKKPKEAAATTVVLKTRVHCDGCAHKINKIISKREGVKEVKVDLAKDQITVKGTMDMKEMLPYLNSKLKRVVEIVPPAKKDEGGNKKPKDGNPGGGDGGGGDKKGKETAKPNNGGGGGGDSNNKKKKGEDSKVKNGGGGGDGGSKAVEENTSKIEVVNKMEYFGYPYGNGAYTYNPQQAQGNGYVAEYWNGPDYMNAPPQYLHAPQMFSDENPNACSIM